MKKEKGITLVALVITIIILLILAGITISFVINDGLLDKTQYAIDKTKTETYKEELLSAAIGALNSNRTLNYDKLNNNLPEGFTEIDGIYIKEDNKYTVSINGRVDTLLPYGYKECEYLESTGTQYIDTGYVPNVKTNVKVKYQLPGWFNHAASYTLLGSNNLSIKFYRFSGGLTNTFMKGKNTAEVYRWGFDYEDVYSMSIFGSDIELVNSQGTYTGIIDVDFTDTIPSSMFIWAMNTETGASEKISGKIYKLTIYEDFITTANFVPALDTNNRPCMFDNVSRQTYYNKGSGEFLYKLK